MSLRLHPTIETFLAPDGDLYLLRGGHEAQVVVHAPTAAELALVCRLVDGTTGCESLSAELLDAGHAVTHAMVMEAVDGLRKEGLLEPESPAADDLSGHDHERYGRQLLYFGDQSAASGIDAVECQRRLQRSRVLVLGIGGLGSWILSALACAGVGSIVGVDFDHVELSNLNRQLLFSERDIGRPKVDAAAEALERFNPGLCFESHHRQVQSAGDVTALLDGVDIAVCAADIPMYEIGRWVNQACVIRRVPWISGGQFPPYIRVGPLYVPGETGCLECQEHSIRASHPFYDALAAFREANPTPSATLGASSGMIGASIAMNVIHGLTAIAQPAVRGQAMITDLRDMSSRWEPVERWQECPVCA